jgi:hypothetical protein
MAGACRYAGISRTTGYEWQELPQVQREIARYAGIAVDHARRMVVGQVREAVRTVRRLMRDASGKGAPTQLAAAKLILDYNNMGVIPVGNQQTRIVSRIPRDQDASETDDTLDTLEAQYQVSELPRIVTPDQLPPDFPRSQAERQHQGYAEPTGRTIPEDLTNPEYYRRSRYE